VLIHIHPFFTQFTGYFDLPCAFNLSEGSDCPSRQAGINPPYAESPFAIPEALPLEWDGTQPPSTGITQCSILLRTYAPDLLPLATLTFTLRCPVFAGCHKTLLASKSFPSLSLLIFLEMSDSLPRCFLVRISSFLPPRHRPSPPVKRIGSQQYSTQQLQCGRKFRGCKYSLMFKPLNLLATLDCSHSCFT
jgi:hypothetical protein